MRRRDFITLLGGAAAAWPLAARTQQSERLRRVGLLIGYRKDNQQVQGWLGAFNDALGHLGWTDGRNVTFDYRWVGDDATLIQQGAAELVAAQPDLILSSGSPLTATLLKLTRTIPVVFVNIVDPVGQGFVESLSRPGGNATGLVNLEPSMAGKWIELLSRLPGADACRRADQRNFGALRGFLFEISKINCVDPRRRGDFRHGCRHDRIQSLHRSPGTRTEYRSPSDAERLFERTCS